MASIPGIPVNATLLAEMVERLQRELASAQERNAQLEREMAEQIMRHEGGAAFEQDSSHYRALALALAWPYAYADIRQAVRALGLGAEDAALQRWLLAHCPTSQMSEIARLYPADSPEP